MAKVIFTLLEDVQDANNFYEVSEYEIVQGNPVALYFRLITTKTKDAEDHVSDLRYLPEVGATVTVHFHHLDSNKTITRVATQPFPNDDRSIWKVDILPTDRIAFDSMRLTLTEGAAVRSIASSSKLISASSGGSGKHYC